MGQLFHQLGIDWHLLLSQAVNFFLVFVVLRIFVYKPLLALLHERKHKIEEGLVKADEAEKRLKEVDEIGKGRIKAAHEEVLLIMKRKETEVKEMEVALIAEAKEKEAEALRNTEVLLRAKEEESRRATEREAAAFVKRAIARTVELSPEKIDDALIEKAIKEAKRT
jgi:F-type H+-transporting ATPase subunit b